MGMKRLMFQVRCPYCEKVDVVALERDVTIGALKSAIGWTAAVMDSYPLDRIGLRADSLLVCERCLEHHGLKREEESREV